MLVVAQQVAVEAVVDLGLEETPMVRVLAITLVALAVQVALDWLLYGRIKRIFIYYYR
jgi:hypothetical protein